MRKKKACTALCALLITALTLTLASKGRSVLANEGTGMQSVFSREEGKGDFSEIRRMNNDREFRGVWIAYYDFDSTKGTDRYTFRAKISAMFEKVKAMNMNSVVVHVRPFSDAMYNSKYYPWSVYASGTQGVSPGYDPLEIMVEEAHRIGLEIHAWLNPYRVTNRTVGTDISKLSKKNPARRWREDDDPSNDRNVLEFGGTLFYNPSSAQVRKLIVNGIKEIVKNYDVDGIHFDDYFYPDSLGDNYASNFDAKEYESYVAARKEAGKSAMSLVKWRRNNVNKLVKSIYTAVKKIDDTVDFGISPGGFIDFLDREHGYYVDYKTWMSVPGYIDYICPQIYWNFDKRCTYPYDTTLKRWIAEKKNDAIKLYVGIPAYKVNSDTHYDKDYGEGVTEQWQDNRIMKRMIKYAWGTEKVDGFIFFDYADMASGRNKKAVNIIAKLFAQ